LQGKYCLVTGATSGVGEAFAHWLAARGAELIVTGRNPDKLDALCAQLRASNPDTTVHALCADHLRLQEVADLAAGLHHLPRLDLLVNNAGLCPGKRSLSPQGYEAAFTINHLSHVLLTLRLLPQIRLAHGYIMHVSSSAMGGGFIDLDDLHGEHWYDGWQAYANSKLAMTLFSNTLAERIPPEEVRSNAVCPGMVRSNLLKGHPKFAGQETALMAASKPPEEAADYLGWMIQDPEVRDLSGCFFSKGFQGRRALKMGWDRAAAEALWERSLELLGSLRPEAP